MSADRYTVRVVRSLHERRYELRDAVGDRYVCGMSEAEARALLAELVRALGEAKP